MLTFLMTDVEGSTRLWEERPDAMRLINARHDDLVAQVVGANGGRTVRSRAEGDSAFAVFDTATAGVTAAVALQKAVAAEPWTGDLEVRVRMALHAGPSGDDEAQFYGPVVNRCARLRGIAHGGQTVVSGTTVELVDAGALDGVHLVDLGVHRLKDLTEPEQVFQVNHPDLPDAFPPLRSLDVARTNLPDPTGALIGREADLAAIAEWLGRTSVLTLSGAGGMGKTRLAIEAAYLAREAHPDGVWLVELAAAADVAAVLPALATTIGVRDQPGRPVLDTVADALRQKRALVLFDNCEHLDIGPTVEQLLHAAPSITVLATSRAPLGVAGERVWRVEPLDPATSAIAMFVDRAAARGTTVDVETVRAICERVDGIPLAIEMAAARTGAMSLAQILASVDDQLASVDEDVPERQRTLRATIAWSHDLLDDDERRLLRRLAVFSGGCTLDAAEGICAAAELGGLDEFDVLDLVARLVGNSLLTIDDRGGQARYRLLETVRAFAEEHLVAAGEREATRSQHLSWFLNLAEPTPYLAGAEQAAMYDRLEIEHDNLRTAITWEGTGPDADLQVRLSAAMAAFWRVRGYWAEGRERLDTVIPRTPRPWSGRAEALYGSGVLCELLGDVPDAESRYAASADDWAHVEGLVAERAAAGQHGAAAQLDLVRGWLISLRLRLGEMARVRGDAVTAIANLTAARDTSSVGGFHQQQAAALASLAAVALGEGDRLAARSQWTHATELFRQMGDLAAASDLLATLADLDLGEGLVDDARHRYEEATNLAASIGYQRGLARGALGTAALAHVQGDDSAAARATEALAQMEGLGDKLGMADALRLLGVISRDRGDLEGAAQRFEAALALRKVAGDPYDIAASEADIAELRTRRDQ